MHILLRFPLKAMGRFRCEAVVVDAKSGIDYQTEDHYFDCFYRFIPNVLERFEKDSVLQALKTSDSSINHTSKGSLEINKKYNYPWVTIDEPVPKGNTLHFVVTKFFQRHF